MNDRNGWMKYRIKKFQWNLFGEKPKLGFEMSDSPVPELWAGVAGSINECRVFEAKTDRLIVAYRDHEKMGGRQFRWVGWHQIDGAV